MSLEKLKEKAKAVEAKNPKAAIAAWEEAISFQEEHADPNPDVTLYNKVGDLYLKAGDPAKGADAYERAVDTYAELGFHNNAIAMCNKVLRNAPGRTHIYLKLAKLFASKGFLAEAKQHFLDYAERMQRAGRVNQAVAALKEFADISPEADELRDILGEHLKAYGATDKRRSSVATKAPEPPKPKG
ncbi:MAG: tetratricopeptide repeat protein, partial [Gemmatimonadales bacterium]